MDPDMVSQPHGGMKHAINLIDYRDSLRKSIRCRPTIKKRRKSTSVDDLSPDLEDQARPSNLTNPAYESGSDTAILKVTFDDDSIKPMSSSLDPIPSPKRQRNPSRRPNHLSIKGPVERLKGEAMSGSRSRLNVASEGRRGSLQPDGIPAAVIAAEHRRASTQLDNLPLILNQDKTRRAEKEKPTTITSEHEFLAWIVNEIEESTAGIGRPMTTSHFFNIVLGGNVHLVKRIIRYLKKFKMKQEVEWVLGTRSERKDSSCSFYMRCFHVLFYLFWVILFLILTPIFYTLHILAYMAHVNTRGKMLLDIKLPMVFAILSEDPDMIQVFLEAGCPLDAEDNKGNNIYHYLADLSLDNPEKAVRCHLILCACVNNVKNIKSLLTERTNHLGITALEAIAKYGSMHFLRFITVDKSCIGSLRLSVSKDMLWADFSNEVFDIKRNTDANCEQEDTECEASLNVWEFDISSYEMGDVYGKQSYLLQLVASRTVESMSEIDVWGFMQSKLLEKWISVKIKWYMPMSAFSHLMYLLITILLLVYIVDHGGDVDPKPLFRVFLHNDLEEVIKAGRAVIQFNESDSDNLTQWDNNCIGWEVTWKDEILDVLDDLGIFYDNCSATALAQIKNHCGDVDPMVLIEQTINTTLNMDGVKMENGPIRLSLDFIILIHIVLDLVIRQGYLWKNYNFKSHKLKNGILPVLIRRFPGSYTEKQLSCLMYFFYAGFLYANYVWYVGIARQYEKDNEYFDYLYSSNRSIYQLEYYQTLAESLKAEMENSDAMAGLTGNLVIVCLMLRFIHTIHALRLLPGVGFFVITTKKMAKHLLQFTIVFVIVSLAFATIFHFVMREVECPAHKIEGFDSLMTSLFSTYQVALGYGEYDFTTSLNARIAYVAYTIISMLLLLNLIIAVMTTTAEELNQVPWKQALCCVELWDEILGTEIAVLSLIAPLRALLWKFQCLCENCHIGRRPVWENIKRTAKKTFEVTYLR